MALAVAAHGFANGATATARGSPVCRGRRFMASRTGSPPFPPAFPLFGHCGVAVPAPGGTSLRSSTRCGARGISSGRRSAAGRRRRRRRGRPSGAPTWGAISRPMRAGSIGTWMRSPCSSPARRARGRSWWQSASAGRVTSPSTRRPALCHHPRSPSGTWPMCRGSWSMRRSSGTSGRALTGATLGPVGCLSACRGWVALLRRDWRLPEHVQVKLLRPLESRESCPSETKPRGPSGGRSSRRTSGSGGAHCPGDGRSSGRSAWSGSTGPAHAAAALLARGRRMRAARVRGAVSLSCHPSPRGSPGRSRLQAGGRGRASVVDAIGANRRGTPGRETCVS